MAKKKFNPLTPPFDLTADSVNDLIDHTQAIHNALLIDARTLEGHLASYFVNSNGVATLSNKTLDSTNVITIKDANLTVQDDLDTSKQAQFQASGISVATRRTITLQDADITMESTIGSQTKVNTHSALTTGIHGIVVTSPITDQILKYNGVSFINSAQVVASVGPGVIFYLDSTKVIPAGIGPQTKSMETLSKTPTAGGEVDETQVVNNNTLLIDQYMYNANIGIVSIDAGEWIFDTYTYVDDATNISELIVSVYKIVAGVGTITITGTGTSRTATVVGGTPFIAGDSNADLILTSRIITPHAVLVVTAFTSDTVLTVECLATYTNEAGVAYSVDRYLFQSSTGEINNLTVVLKEHITVQPAFATNTTDKLVTRYFAKTNNVGNITVHLVHNGTTHYTHFHTPLTTKHNDLVGLQGGAGSEFYHLTSAEYATIVRTTYADATLSGTPIIIRIDIGGTPYYFKAYPTKV